MRRRAPAMLLLGCLVLLPCGAGAQSSPSSVLCVLTATPLSFGSYQPARGQPVDLTATLIVTCTTPLAAAVPVTGTLALSGGVVRRMAQGGAVLRYQLYADPTHSAVWGDGSGGSVTVRLGGTVSRAVPLRIGFTVYGRLLARQASAGIGTYTDLLTATLTY